jgi:hypothetical protein
MINFNPTPRFKGVLKDKRFSTMPKFDQYGQKSNKKNKEFEDHYIENQETD